MPSILFVCTGNTCRSPMAEGLFRHHLLAAHSDPAAWQVASAGTWAADGQPASPQAVAVMAQRGIDLRQHRSQCVTPELLAGFDLILTMERSHRDALLAEFPNLFGRVFLLSEMVGRDFDIADPIGKAPIEYEHTAQQIESLLQRGWEEIMRRVTSNKEN